ncbi:MAG: DUF4928 family protein [Planctomycetales bacterium]
MPAEHDAIRILNEWYEGLSRHQDDLPAKGSIQASLVVLSRLRTDYDLEIASHLSGGQAQIKGLSVSSVKRILLEFGEERELSRIGGRTNRGTPGDIAKLLALMIPLRLDELPPDQRVRALNAMLRHIVTSFVDRFHQVKRVRASFDQSKATSHFIGTILANAQATRKCDAVAEYLIGAKLAVIYPDKSIRNKHFSAADMQAGYGGDFHVGNTVFHITLAATRELLHKAVENLDAGLGVYLLVLRKNLEQARQLADYEAGPGRIEVDSIESFIAKNMDEAVGFDRTTPLKSELRHLLEIYNERVGEVDHDTSMLIEIPPNLL